MDQQLKNIIEAALLAAGGSLSLDQMLLLFEESALPEKKALREVLAMLAEDYQNRGMQLIETGSGWRIQIRAEYADWVSRLWQEKPARYSRALMETLALVAYRQPITRGEIEEVRGVSVSSNIIKTLQEREWVRVVGHRDVPGKPALYATTKIFLDYFNLKSLNDLPTLAEIRDLDSLNEELKLDEPDQDKPDQQDKTDGVAVDVGIADDELTAVEETASEADQVTPVDTEADTVDSAQSDESPEQTEARESEAQIQDQLEASEK